MPDPDSHASDSASSVQSPPSAAQPVDPPDTGPRARLHELAQQLIRTNNRRLLTEFLTLRRALR